MRSILTVAVFCVLSTYTVQAQDFLSYTGGSINAEYDTFRGVGDVGRQDNSGANFGANIGVQLFGDLNAQIGVNHGVYDWRGRINTTTGNALRKTMQQTFITTGLFSQADYAQQKRFGWGIFHDWMLGKNWGIVGDDDITLGQVRGQVEFAINQQDTLGVIGIFDSRDEIGGLSGSGDPNIYEPIDNVRLFWDHDFCNGANLNSWVGIPVDSAPERPGTTIDVLFGSTASMPLNQSWDAYGAFMYGNPSSSAEGFGGANGEIYSSVAFGLTYYPGGRNRAGMPMLGVANNRSFLVDNGRVR